MDGVHLDEWGNREGMERRCCLSGQEIRGKKHRATINVEAYIKSRCGIVHSSTTLDVEFSYLFKFVTMSNTVVMTNDRLFMKILGLLGSLVVGRQTKRTRDGKPNEPRCEPTNLTASKRGELGSANDKPMNPTNRRTRWTSKPINLVNRRSGKPMNSENRQTSKPANRQTRQTDESDEPKVEPMNLT